MKTHFSTIESACSIHQIFSYRKIDRYGICRHEFSHSLALVRRVVVCSGVVSRPRISERAKHQYRNNRVSQMREPPRHPKQKLGHDVAKARRASRSCKQNSTNHAALESHLLTPDVAT